MTSYNTPFRTVTIPVPTALGPRDLLAKIAAASYCHTDSMVQSGDFNTPLPYTASHEGAGTVVAVGSDVTDFLVGERIVCGIPQHACGQADCDGCGSSDPQRVQYCSRFQGMAGVTSDGFFVEYAIVDAAWCTPLPDAVSLITAAPLACAGRTVFRGVLTAELAAGQTLVIVGAGGGLGHIGVQMAKAMGLTVVGVDARDDGLALTREAGADLVVDARRAADEAVREVQAITGGKGADAALVLSDAKDATALACAMTRVAGRVVQVAQPEEVVVPFREIVFRDIRIVGSLLCSPDESRQMVRFVAEHGIKVKTVPFHGLDKIGELVELVHSGTIQGKPVIIIDEEQIEREKALGARP